MNNEAGHIHPISSLIREANRIFYDMGFTFVDAPLVESEWYNFDALNVPKDHPARDVQDTFFMKDEPGVVLRTHMSNVQVRYMESQMKKGILPPYRIVYPGRVFRNEATDMTHEAEFYQLECLAVAEDITMAHLRYTIERLLQGIFKNIRSPLLGMRYHSLVGERISLPAELEITAETDDDTIMGVKHKKFPIFGIQFHPESIGTEDGLLILKNFLGSGL